MKLKYMAGGLLLAAVAAILAVPLLGAQEAQAQGRDCYHIEEEYTHRINPFTGQEESFLDRDREYHDERCAEIRDGRENRLDKAAGAAIYCDDYGVLIYDLDISGHGSFAFRATWDEINRVPTNPTENTLIEGVPGFALYRLTTGEMQLNGVADSMQPPYSVPYVFTWEGCTPPAE